MKKSYKVAFALCLSSVLALTACGNGQKDASGTSSSGDQKVVLKVPHYKAGSNAGAKFFLPQIERFNKKYAGKYEIQIEEVPDDKYREKIKLLWQQKQLPALVEAGDTQFVEQLMQNDEMYDLKPWLDSKPEIKKLLIDDSVAYNTKNGKLYTMPLTVVRPAGIYYNKEMFQKAGITKPISQMNFDEFDKALQALKDKGITPLSLMTGENAWTTMLLATSFLANEPGGAEVLKSAQISYDYTSPMWIKTFAEVQKWLKNYATPNAIGATYADAANGFMNEKAAMIANGPWMAADFLDKTKAPEGFDKKVGLSLNPGGVGIDNVLGYSWWIPKGLKKEETEAALAFLEFRYTPEELQNWMIAEGGFAPKMPNSADVNSKVNPVLGEFNQQAATDLKTVVKAAQDIWPNQIGQKEFGAYLAQLAKDGTPEQFAQQLTKKAQQFKQ